MKTLYLQRHAKSSWKHNVIDHERPLKARGITDAKLVANALHDRVRCPEKIMTSDANRAFTTALFFKEIFEVKDADFETHHTLYDFSGTQVMDFIKALPNSLQCVMIVGHNYALTSLANMLGNVYIENIPTSGFVALTFSDTNWTNLNRGITTLTVFPKDLKKAK